MTPWSIPVGRISSVLEEQRSLCVLSVFMAASSTTIGPTLHHVGFSASTMFDVM